METYLRSAFMPPDYLPGDLYDQLQIYWERAEMVEAQIRERVHRTDADTNLRLRTLQQRLNVTDLERDVLLICLLGEVDERYRRLYGYLQDDASRTRPGTDLILNILRPVENDIGSARSLFDGESTLQTVHLIELGADERHDLPSALRSVEV